MTNTWPYTRQKCGTSLVVQRFIFTAGACSIPTGTEIPRAKRHSQKLITAVCFLLAQRRARGLWWWLAAVSGSPLQKGFPPCFPSQLSFGFLPAHAWCTWRGGRKEAGPHPRFQQQLAAPCQKLYPCALRVFSNCFSLLNTVPFRTTQAPAGLAQRPGHTMSKRSLPGVHLSGQARGRSEVPQFMVNV